LHEKASDDPKCHGEKQYILARSPGRKSLT